jgi:iron complex outermembrane receptor protein
LSFNTCGLTMSSSFKHTPLPVASLAFIYGLLTPAFAQTLDEVVISASRAQARSFDAPAAIQSVVREVIQNGGPQVNLSESLVRVPGLTILDRSNYAQDLQLSIRGFGARAAFGIRGIRLLIDGIPATTPDGQGQGSSVSLTSMDRIEVLRGPLAQLYGNASGGVIQAFTKPASAVPLVDYQYFVGDYGLHRADYQFSNTVGDYGIVADYSTFTIDGYRDNSRTERKQFNGKVGFNTNDQTRVNLVFNQFDMPLAQDPLGLTDAQRLANPVGAGNYAGLYQTRKAVLQTQLGGAATYTVDRDRSFTGRAYYGTRDNLQYQSATSVTNPPAATWVGLNRKYFGVGLQYNEKTVWGDTPVQWAGGYEFDRSREYREGGATKYGDKFGALTRSEDNQAENSDFFAQATARVSDAVSVVGGVRYSTVRFISDDYFITPTNPDGSGNASYSAASPVLGLTYFANDNLNLYANYGRGFESPTLAEVAYQGSSTPVAQFNPALNASSSQHYELGAKWVPQRGSRLDLAVFQINSTDEIVVAASASGQTSYKNAPGTSRTGFELTGSTLVTPHLAATMSASMLDAQYSQAFKSGTTSVASGNKIPGIPQTSFFSELAWTGQAATAGAKTAALGPRLAVELVHSGRIYADDINAASVDGHSVFNLSASQRWAVDKTAVTLYARLNNVSDERFVGSVIVNQSSKQFYEPGLPKNWMLGISVSAPL